MLNSLSKVAYYSYLYSYYYKYFGSMKKSHSENQLSNYISKTKWTDEYQRFKPSTNMYMHLLHQYIKYTVEKSQRQLLAIITKLNVKILDLITSAIFSKPIHYNCIKKLI